MPLGRCALLVMLSVLRVPLHACACDAVVRPVASDLILDMQERSSHYLTEVTADCVAEPVRAAFTLSPVCSQACTTISDSFASLAKVCLSLCPGLFTQCLLLRALTCGCKADLGAIRDALA